MIWLHTISSVGQVCRSPEVSGACAYCLYSCRNNYLTEKLYIMMIPALAIIVAIFVSVLLNVH